jgi:phage I-like protein
MKTKKHPLNLAVLSATAEPVAVLSVDLNADAGGWQQLLPAGRFQAVDGRPFDVHGNHWYIDAEVAQQLISLAQARTNDLVIDYDHQTLKAEENGLPAPASGWFKEMEWREGSGLWIKPKWTPRATDFIKNGEYKFLSAVFPYDAATGRPLRLHSAALVNRAGIDGLQAVEALAALSLANPPTHPNATLQEHSMNELLKKMLAQLGITVEDGQEPDETAALAALSALQTKAGSVDTLATEVAALKANESTGAVDPAKFVPIAVVTDLQAKLAVLSAEGQTTQLDQTIAKAKQEGRLIESMEEWALDLGKKDFAALQAFLDKSQPIAALAGMQTDGKKPPADTPDPLATLSAEEKKVCRECGISEADYLKTKNGDK